MPDTYRPVADDIGETEWIVLTERELIEYRGDAYRSIAEALLKIKTKRQLADIIMALQLAALL